MRLTRTRLLWFTGTVALGLLWRRVVRFVQVDRCLDRGGGWNDITATCKVARAVLSSSPSSGTGHYARWIVAAIGVAGLIAVFSWRDSTRASRRGD